VEPGAWLEGIEFSLERVEVVARPVALEPNAVERMSHRIALARVVAGTTGRKANDFQNRRDALCT
jgi:hypothetical protein